MKYRAACPSCRHRFSRAYFFRALPEYKHTCPSCGAKIKANSKWEWIGSSVFAIPSGLLIFAAIIGGLPWPHAMGIVAFVFALAYTFFPYFTKYDLIDTHEAVERKDEQPSSESGPSDGVSS